MGQTVYVDLFFLINFSMDFLCFFITAKIMGGKLSLLRALIASGVGGIYANIMLFVPLPWGIALALDLAVCVAMCLIAFGGGGGIIRNTLAYIAASVILGGFMTAIFTLLDRVSLPIEEVEEDGISAWMLALLATVSAVGTVAAGRFFKRRSAKKYISVTVFFCGVHKKLRAFCDSGNLLRDPISGKPCVVADADALNDIIPKEILAITKTGISNITVIKNTEMQRRIRLIPTVSATGNATLIALRVDKLVLGDGKEQREVDALLCISPMGKTDGTCDALVPTELLI